MTKRLWTKLCNCRRVNPFQYKQAFTKTGERLCVKCLGQVPGCTVGQQVGDRLRCLMVDAQLW